MDFLIFLIYYCLYSRFLSFVILNLIFHFSLFLYFIIIFLFVFQFYRAVTREFAAESVNGMDDWIMKLQAGIARAESLAGKNGKKLTFLSPEKGLIRGSRQTGRDGSVGGLKEQGISGDTITETVSIGVHLSVFLYWCVCMCFCISVSSSFFFSFDSSFSFSPYSFFSSYSSLSSSPFYSSHITYIAIDKLPSRFRRFKWLWHELSWKVFSSLWGNTVHTEDSQHECSVHGCHRLKQWEQEW